MSQRPGVITPVAGRIAAVAVPIVLHPDFGECLIVTRRAMVNGHTGNRMSHAGEVVLFGGSVEANESPWEAALRELCEEAGTRHLINCDAFTVRGHLGTWTTESGFLVEGYSIDVPASFIDEVEPDPREVAEIAYLRVDDLRVSSVALEYHPVHSLDHGLGPKQDAEFESPTIRVRHPVSGQIWMLWGLAGFMVSRWLTADADA